MNEIIKEAMEYRHNLLQQKLRPDWFKVIVILDAERWCDVIRDLDITMMQNISVDNTFEYADMRFCCIHRYHKPHHIYHEELP